MITLTLLHSNQAIPVQSWTFEHESVIRIGRATDNHVVLYSAVVSRHHVELRFLETHWEVVNLGTNGTYLDGKRITQVPIVDGATIRLARSGPNIQIHVGTGGINQVPPLSGEQTLSQQASRQVAQTKAIQEISVLPNVIPVPLHSQSPLQVLSKLAEISHQEAVASSPQPSLLDRLTATPLAQSTECQHPRLSPNLRFCLDCGQPLQPEQVIGDYQVVGTLQQEGTGITYLAWRNGQSFILKTLNPEWSKHAKALELFNREAKVLETLNHPGIPQFVDFFCLAGQPYLVMEMIYGQDLAKQVATQGPVAEPQAIAWMLEVCEILEYLHSTIPPILHRDIKPSNLIRRTVQRDSHAIAVVGFGAVQVWQLETTPSTNSLNYIAPEQQAGQTTPASDLYSLGLTLIYLLTGQSPSLFYQAQEQRIQVEQIPGITNDMRHLVEALIEPQLEKRYSSAGTVIHALYKIQGG